MATVEYRVVDMRAVPPTESVKRNNPDRFVTIKGTFFDTEGNEFSFKTKDITFDMARDENTVIDKVNGILIIPTGDKGRHKAVSISQEDIEAQLEALRASK